MEAASFGCSLKLLQPRDPSVTAQTVLADCCRASRGCAASAAEPQTESGGLESYIPLSAALNVCALFIGPSQGLCQVTQQQKPSGLAQGAQEEPG
jgi:hypothetical protein